MVVFPNAKINLGLRILRKRPDGFHDLETIFYPIPFYDSLEILLPVNEQAGFHSSGFSIQGNKDSNLVYLAHQLLKKDHPSIPDLHAYLHKAIPMGAGLGGGSADAAFALVLMNQLYGLNLSNQQLMDYGLQLGSDCPFFIHNQPTLAAGRGELLEPVEVSLKEYLLVLVNPGIHINTRDAFSLLTPTIPPRSLKEIIKQPVGQWRNNLVNDFELPVFLQHPEIGIIKETLYTKGASYASLSGSGSTVYGIFPKDSNPAFTFPSNYLVKVLAGEA